LWSSGYKFIIQEYLPHFLHLEFCLRFLFCMMKPTVETAREGSYN
jgi:hypothetical protein